MFTDRPWLTLLACALAAATLAACGPSTEYVAPSGFVNLDDDRLPHEAGQKSVSADGAIILLRERDNEPEGNLAFWSEALQREIVEGRGYELVDKSNLSGARIPGVVFQFKGTYSGVPYRYDVALYVRDDIIVTIETAAPEESYDAHSAAFEEARRSLRDR